jgi:hypothetical protein
MSPPSPPPDATTALSQRFEALRAAYDRFIGGLDRAEPTQERKQFLLELRRALGRPSSNTGQTFRLQALKARVLTYEAMWDRAVAAKEASHRPRLGGVTTKPPKEAAAPPAPKAAPDGSSLTQLHQQFVQAAQAAGQSTPMGYDAFAAMVGREMERIRQRTGWQQVGLQVTVQNGKPALKAFRKP